MNVQANRRQFIGSSGAGLFGLLGLPDAFAGK